MSLSTLYQELHRRARETGEDRASDLTGGARLSVRVRGDVTTITIARKGKRLSDTEIITFQRHICIPPDATRYPPEGQSAKVTDGVVWHYIGYKWSDE
jgi:hypothetical protein